MARAPLHMFVCLFMSAAMAQGTPEAAFAELVLAKDFKAASKHYPVAVVDALSDLPAQDLAAAKNELLRVRAVYGVNVTPTASDDPSQLVALDSSDPKRKFSLRVKRRLSDGVTALVELQSCEDNACWGDWRVWMRLEDGEWRLSELQQGFSTTRVVLTDPDLIDKLKHAEIHHNEDAAIQRLQQINGAVVQYAYMFKDLGFPEELAVMVKEPEKPDLQANAETTETESQDQEEAPPPDPQHAGFLDQEFGKAPYVLEGYKFEYTLLRHGRENTGAYSVVATPVNFGKTGSRSFFIDESGVIRVTREERAATFADLPLFESNRRNFAYVR